MTPYSGATNGPEIAKTNINTADFPHLWRAFWNVMHDDTTPANPPAEAMFNSSMRNATATALTKEQMAILRSAIAAVNAEDLRDGDDNVTSQFISIPAVGAGATAYNAVVYGTEKQPFITEDIVDIENTTPPEKRYIGLELHNPYQFTAISLKNCVLARLNTAVSPQVLTPIHAFADTDTIAAGGFLVIENTANRPATITPPTGAVIDEAGPDWVDITKGREIVLLRPRMADGTLSSAAGVFDETNLSDRIPVDQIDLISAVDPAAGNESRYTYDRGTGMPNEWKWVYPGHWTAAGGTPLVPDPNSPPTAPGSLGLDNAAASYLPTFTIQVNNDGWGGPNPVTSGTGNMFPFGGFARNGDILEVPFIGAYRLSTAGGTDVLTLNSVTMDSSLAEDGDASDDTVEQIGRFSPLTRDGFTGTDHYAWAAKLFDYLTVHSPADDYLPNVNQAAYTAAGGTQPAPVANGTNPLVANREATNPNNLTEDTAPVEGLININTASWKVLATLPLLPNFGGGNSGPIVTLAQAIQANRLTVGPFKSIYDLYRVPEFAAAFSSTGNPLQSDGDITPADATGTANDNVSGDFEAQFLTLNRISNLITTRSDSFTVYIVVEGWQNAGTANAKRITQRRAAYIIDRSGITATQTDPQVTYVPNQ
jgi:hypothetical protein